MGATSPVAAQRTEVSPVAPAETIQTHGCRVVLRSVQGPGARELFLLASPPAESTDAGEQASAIYRAVLGVLDGQGGHFGSVVTETLFLRSLRADLEPVRAARLRVLVAGECATHRPATTEIEQPPLADGTALEVALHAVLPNDASSLPVDVLAAEPACACPECARSHALRVQRGR